MTAITPKHTNRLAKETSPYLLQHAHNPVDWYPWGDDALARARKDDRLILLSIGYSACHWCHVMERESFENEAIAALMNEHFVNIKVDREERPDIDEVYMAATLALNQGQGGWPMTVFLTPALEPVFAGTYFPPRDYYGRPGFATILEAIAKAWQQNRAQLDAQAAGLVAHLHDHHARTEPAMPVGEAELRSALRQFSANFDPEYGGFGSAPKFPPATALSLLLRLHVRFADRHALDIVCTTLDAMARGGIYDQVGGGFARYSTDREWLVPHFEKMLYDNALLTSVYLEAFQVTGNLLYRRIATETLDYVIREMTSERGGFYSSTDADSEGEEGKFFVWTPDQVLDVLDDEAARRFAAFYDITAVGNWDGKSIPRIRRPAELVAKELGISRDELESSLASAREKVYAARQMRVPPGLDDKVLTAWNGLMIRAFADGYRILLDLRYLKAARGAADFLKATHASDTGELLRTSRSGRAHVKAYLEDYAYLSEGLISLYEAGGHVHDLLEARRLMEHALEEFGDEGSGALFHTGHSHEKLIVRYREGTDGATPSANAVAASALARLSHHFDRKDLRNAAGDIVQAFGQSIAQYPRAFAESLIVVDFLSRSPVELAYVAASESTRLHALRQEAAKVFVPRRIEAVADPAVPETMRQLPLVEGKALVNGDAALYVCRNFSCHAPITDPALVVQALAAGTRDPGLPIPEGTPRAPGVRE